MPAISCLTGLTVTASSYRSNVRHRVEMLPSWCWRSVHRPSSFVQRSTLALMSLDTVAVSSCKLESSSGMSPYVRASAAMSSCASGTFMPMEFCNTKDANERCGARSTQGEPVSAHPGARDLCAAAALSSERAHFQARSQSSWN